MKVAEQTLLRQRVYFMLGRHHRKYVLNHFLSENVSRRTMYNIFKRYDNELPAENEKKPGRKPLLTSAKRQQLKKAAVDKIGASNRSLARKFRISKETVRQNLLKMDVKYHKRIAAPRYSQKQLEEIPKKCRLFRRKFLKPNSVLILDDEKYFTFSCSNRCENKGFYSDIVQNSPDNIRFIKKAKFEQKVLVWCAISVKGISQLHIRPSKGPAINTDIYIEKCLKKVKRFIDSHHQGDEILFWPDLASSHYAKKTVDWLLRKNINFVSKEANPPNIPKARPIEDFWAILSKEVYKGGWEAQTYEQMVNRIRTCVRKVPMQVVQKMLKDVPKKLRKIEDKGPLSLYK